MDGMNDSIDGRHQWTASMNGMDDGIDDGIDDGMDGRHR